MGAWEGKEGYKKAFWSNKYIIIIIIIIIILILVLWLVLRQVASTLFKPLSSSKN